MPDAPEPEDILSLAPEDTVTLRRPGRTDNAVIEELRDKVERLLLITEALWKIVRERHGLEEDALVKQIIALDLEDGRLDAHKPPSAPVPCPKCGRALSKTRPRCMFCGELVALDPFVR